MKGWHAALLALVVTAAPRLGAVAAAELVSVESLQHELQTLRAQNAALQREVAELKAKLAGGKAQVVAQDETERQEDKPKNRIRLPANVTINHEPR